jgi:hypothetical protein
MVFGYLVGVHQSGVDLCICLNESMELPAQFKQALFSIGLSSEACSHHSQGSRKSTHECRDATTGWRRFGVSNSGQEM